MGSRVYLSRGMATVAGTVGPSVAKFRSQQIEQSLRAGKANEIDTNLFYEASLAAGVGAIGNGVNFVIEKVKQLIINPTDNIIAKALRSGINAFAQEISETVSATPQEVKAVFINPSADKCFRTKPKILS